MEDEELIVVGLNGKQNGRSCHAHSICGQQVKSGDVLCFHGVPTVVRKKKGRGIAAVLVKDGTETCRVGFLNTTLLSREAELEGKHARVTQVLSDDKNKTPIDSDREVFYCNKGGCKVLILNVDKTNVGETDDDDARVAKRLKTEDIVDNVDKQKEQTNN